MQELSSHKKKFAAQPEYDFFWKNGGNGNLTCSIGSSNALGQDTSNSDSAVGDDYDFSFAGQGNGSHGSDQGKYWPYHDEIYKNSKGENVAWVTKDILKRFASNVNIPNFKKFSECLDAQNHSNIVEQNDNLANSIGLQATPSFILLSTGKSQQQLLLIDGAQPYSAFQQAIAKVQSST